MYRLYHFVANFVNKTLVDDSTIQKHPDIGRVMERYVHENKVGADAWRRTGVFTFDGNTKRGPKVTYRRMQEYLKDYYNEDISYGTTKESYPQKGIKGLHR